MVTASFDVNSALGCLHSVDVGSTANVLEIHAGFCFKRTIKGSEDWFPICAIWSKN
jgi:hypothetical protein